MVGALAAYYHRLPVAHLEAGLRTDDLFQPFPEEGNRRLIGSLAALHFPPTAFAADNLRREGVPEGRLLVTGNTVIDALLHVRRRLALDLVPPAGYRRILLTMHRRENGGQPFEEICGAVLDLVRRNPDVDVLFPVHASPAVRTKDMAAQLTNGEWLYSAPGSDEKKRPLLGCVGCHQLSKITMSKYDTEGFVHTSHLVQPLVIDTPQAVVPAILTEGANIESPQGVGSVIDRM